jgi:hypothetical protein
MLKNSFFTSIALSFTLHAAPADALSRGDAFDWVKPDYAFADIPLWVDVFFERGGSPDVSLDWGGRSKPLWEYAQYLDPFTNTWQYPKTIRGSFQVRNVGNNYYAFIVFKNQEQAKLPLGIVDMSRWPNELVLSPAPICTGSSNAEGLIELTPIGEEIFSVDRRVQLTQPVVTSQHDEWVEGRGYLTQSRWFEDENRYQGTYRIFDARLTVSSFQGGLLRVTSSPDNTRTNITTTIEKTMTLQHCLSGGSSAYMTTRVPINPLPTCTSK